MELTMKSKPAPLPPMENKEQIKEPKPFVKWATKKK
jgi:hypothetical protein